MKKMQTTSMLELMILGISMMVLTGCTHTPPTRFYLIEPIESTLDAQAKVNMGPVVGVGPLEIPAYLDRPQIVTKTRNHEIILGEFDLWAEPLKDAIPRVFARYLHLLLGSQVEVDPWLRSRQVEYRISAKVMRLEGTLDGQALMEIQWKLADERKKKICISRDSRYTTALSTNGYSDLAAAYSRMLADFSREVTKELNGLAGLK